MENACIVGEEGLRGVVLGPSESGDDEVAIELEDGREISVPASALTQRRDGLWYIDTSRGVRELSTAEVAPDLEQTVIPVIAEEVNATTRKIPTGKVRVTKQTTEHTESVSMPVVRETAHVKRVVVNRPVDGPLPVRREGDTIIMPVVEEVAVVEKRLMLKEEIHITRQRSTELHNQDVTLRTERAQVERAGTSGQLVPDEPEPERVSAPGRRSILDPTKTIPTVLEPVSPSRARRNRILTED